MLMLREALGFTQDAAATLFRDELYPGVFPVRYFCIHWPDSERNQVFGGADFMIS
jgi:hypothetical protein